MGKSSKATKRNFAKPKVRPEGQQAPSNAPPKKTVAERHEAAKASTSHQKQRLRGKAKGNKDGPGLGEIDYVDVLLGSRTKAKFAMSGGRAQ
ncbi:uncharacterized protein EI90DRAFT_3122014 [Cantharellus anzutake]|uniref:uncharacterized protein n=1 Tax=Cantharellus anzutake TaxID=1750568 RepID=UPI0019059A12|nr:uncharacterized protein EI90DRAFT_3122014 [Cantharellus anzutake]KAF8333016.1 hypothetical protein EI90DRAFT_3122014 [Cantharellus anzutake]